MTSSRSMPSGLSSSGIRKAALVVVVKAEPIFTLRRFWPSEARDTMAGAANEAAAAAMRLRRNINGFSPRAAWRARNCKARAKP